MILVNNEDRMVNIKVPSVGLVITIMPNSESDHIDDKYKAAIKPYIDCFKLGLKVSGSKPVEKKEVVKKVVIETAKETKAPTVEVLTKDTTPEVKETVKKAEVKETKATRRKVKKKA